MEKLAALGLLAAITLSALGLGAAVRRVTPVPGGPAVEAGVGLAALVLLGGVLNLLRLALPPVLWAALAAGVALGAVALRRARWPAPRTAEGRREAALAAAVVLGATAFAAATQLPPAALNHHDDLQKYLVHPVRMLALGTVGGNPLGALPAESLGGQAFLHGLLLLGAPLADLAGLDAVLGVFLLALLGAVAGGGRLRPLPGAALAALAVAVVHAQGINVSALYLGAALVATGALVAAESREDPPPLALGLVYGAAIALKTTFAVFVGLHAVALAVGLAGAHGPRRALAWTARAGLWTGLAVAPWLVVHASALLDPGPPAPDVVPPGVTHALSSLLSLRPLFYGATAAHYVALSLAGLAGAIAIALGACAGGTAGRARALAGSLMAGALSFVVLVPILGNAMAGFGHGIRLAIPILLGAVVVPLAAVPEAAEAPRRAIAWAPAALLGAVTLSFVPAWLEQTGQAARAGGSVPAFRVARSPEYQAMVRALLSDEARARMRAAQRAIPAGAPVLVLASAPYFLDQRRNPAYTVEVGFELGASTRVPPDASWVVWQYAGPGVRTVEQVQDQLGGAGARQRLLFARTLSLLRWLEERARTAPRAYDDGEVAVFRAAD